MFQFMSAVCTATATATGDAMPANSMDGTQSL